jgi:hypothetical protein
MSLTIKSRSTEHLARLLAREAGESITETIQKSLQERWEMLKTRRGTRILRQQIDEILHRVDELPTVDSRLHDEILRYDEYGMPR